MVHDAQAAVENARAGDAALSGVLRVTSTAEYGNHFLIPALAAFGALHPQLKIEFSSSPLNSNLVMERFDVAVRLGPLNDSTLKAALLGRFRVVAAATPSYLSGRSMPRTPQQLSRFDWVMHKGFQGALTWNAKRAPARSYRVKLEGRYQADTAAAVLGFVLAECGAGLLPDWLISRELASNALVDVLPAYGLPQQDIHALFPNTQYIPSKVRKLIDFLRLRLGESV
ncbi:MAG: substrate binding domain-containing protein [Telluria sp.]